MEIENCHKVNKMNHLEEKPISIPFRGSMEMEIYRKKLGSKVLDLPLFFLEYSVSQKCFHFDDVFSILDKNRDICIGGRKCDYIIIAGPMTYTDLTKEFRYWASKLPIINDF